MLKQTGAAQAFRRWGLGAEPSTAEGHRDWRQSPHLPSDFCDDSETIGILMSCGAHFALFGAIKKN